ncbi:MAG: SDR family oxidoreductase, partial [Terriglobales bacterium]
MGSTLTPLLLAAGHQVRVLDQLTYGGESLLGVWCNPGFEFVRGDICERVTVRTAVSGRDAVVHLAAIVGDPACARKPDLARATNLDASLALIEESQRSGVGRFIFASTCSNYGKMKDASEYVDEESELRPVSLYAETKVAVEMALLKSANGNNWCPTPLRFSTVYGVSPRMRFDLTVNEFTMEMLTKKHLTVFGEQFWRPYVHVHDAARAIQLVLSAPPDIVAGRVFNVGATDQNFQKQQLVDLIRPYAPEA